MVEQSCTNVLYTCGCCNATHRLVYVLGRSLHYNTPKCTARVRDFSCATNMLESRKAACRQRLWEQYLTNRQQRGENTESLPDVNFCQDNYKNRQNEVSQLAQLQVVSKHQALIYMYTPQSNTVVLATCENNLSCCSFQQIVLPSGVLCHSGPPVCIRNTKRILQFSFFIILSLLIKKYLDLNWITWAALGGDNGRSYRQVAFVPESHRWPAFPGPISPHGRHRGHKSVGATQATAAWRFRTRRLLREGGGEVGRGPRKPQQNDRE